jgi:hypothetical protein
VAVLLVTGNSRGTQNATRERLTGPQAGKVEILQWIRNRSAACGTPIPAPLFALLLLIGMLFLLEIGRRFGVRRRPKESEGERGGLGTVEGAVFALFGLMVAFTFSGAATRFNEKRMLVAEEANCIETAYLRPKVVAILSLNSHRMAFAGDNFNQFRRLVLLSVVFSRSQPHDCQWRASWTLPVTRFHPSGHRRTTKNSLLPGSLPCLWLWRPAADCPPPWGVTAKATAPRCLSHFGPFRFHHQEISTYSLSGPQLLESP